MNKQEYILKYGEEKYQDKLKRDAEYRKKNKERLREYFKNRWENVKDVENEKRREKYATNDDYREDRLKRSSQYSKTHKIARRNTPEKRAERLVSDYKNDDKKNNRPGFNITTQWILENVFSGQKCIYCDCDDWTKLGLDRIDNSLAHTIDNVVVSCGRCNNKRRKIDFQEYLKRIGKTWQDRKNTQPKRKGNNRDVTIFSCIPGSAGT